MITCSACAKQNQDHYRFCLGCGAELPRAGAAVADESTELGAAAETAPKPAEAAPAAEPATGPDAGSSDGSGNGSPAAAAAPSQTTCPQCDHENPPTNRFCASCGFRIEEEQKAAAPEPAPSATDGPELIALDPEGNEIGRFSLVEGTQTLGRNSGGVFESDAFLSPEHATFACGGGEISVVDAGSLNGVYRKIKPEVRTLVAKGQRFRIGQELLQYDPVSEAEKDSDGVDKMGCERKDLVGKISLVVGRDAREPAYPLRIHGLSLGRERGEILFPEDGYVSGLHCNVSCDGDEVYVTDLGSSNGTFVQVIEEQSLENGDVLLLGQQLFQLSF